jgi:hypothetical protein
MELKKEDLSFAKRFGFESVEIPFQRDNMDDVLRTELWNAFYIFIYRKLEDSESYMANTYRSFHKVLWVHFFKKPLDDFPGFDSKFSYFVRGYIEKEIWYKVYEFFESVFRNIKYENNYKYLEFAKYVNSKLRENNSAYTLNEDKFIPITNEAEINELKQTQNSAKQHGLVGIQ